MTLCRVINRKPVRAAFFSTWKGILRCKLPPLLLLLSQLLLDSNNNNNTVASYVSQNAIQAGSAATAASERKTAKYSNLSSSHVFYPVAVETLGALADDALVFLAEIGRKARLCTADLRETTFLYQRISVAIQRFNPVCLANSLTVSESTS